MAADPAATPATRVAICIASCERPEGLRALLRSIAGLRFRAAAPDLCVVVADNDARGTAWRVCEEARRWLSVPLHYVVEPERGISRARNASLTPVLTRVDWVAFVDDDETLDVGWLDALLAQQRATGADVVSGPVLTEFNEAPPEWIVEGDFLGYPRFADGATRPFAYTNNALARSACLLDQALLFDESMPTGEDVELFSRLVRDGAEIVWADLALVTEHVPAERACLSYVLRRGLREGIASARLERRAGKPGVVGIALRGVGRIAHGLALALFSLRSWRARRARGLKLATFGLGRLVGLVVDRRSARRVAPQ